AECANDEECGNEAWCVDGECMCRRLGFGFNKDSKTCLEKECIKECGRDPSCAWDSANSTTCFCNKRPLPPDVCATAWAQIKELGAVWLLHGGAGRAGHWQQRVRQPQPRHRRGHRRGRGRHGGVGLRHHRQQQRRVKLTGSPLLVGCEITTCHKDCGAAECVVKEGKPQCQCPEGLVFNAAKKLCRAAPPRSQVQACLHWKYPVHVGGRKVSVWLQGGLPNGEQEVPE
ncbi:unnamed protein product, partial [Closterium sp. Naga37s-1]